MGFIFLGAIIYTFELQKAWYSYRQDFHAYGRGQPEFKVLNDVVTITATIG